MVGLENSNRPPEKGSKSVEHASATVTTAVPWGNEAFQA